MSGCVSDEAAGWNSEIPTSDDNRTHHYVHQSKDVLKNSIVGGWMYHMSVYETKSS